MSDYVLNNETLPGLYQSSNSASLKAQSIYFFYLGAYLLLLIMAAGVSFVWPEVGYMAIVSALLFLFTLGILIFLRVKRPDDQWYNGRAVAESVKTRSWRWCMRADPYLDTDDVVIASKMFISDLKSILEQNRGLSGILESQGGIKDPISDTMNRIRSMGVADRLEIYREQRIDDQAKWYAKKSQFNKRRTQQWFWVSVVLHVIAVSLFIYRVKDPLTQIPVGVIAAGASAVLTWLQAKKHNELSSAYTLTAHEITLIEGDALSVKSEADLSAFVINSETAFSREHTQWAARRSE